MKVVIVFTCHHLMELAFLSQGRFLFVLLMNVYDKTSVSILIRFPYFKIAFALVFYPYLYSTFH